VPRPVSDRLAAQLHDDAALSDIAAAIERAADVVAIDREHRAALGALLAAGGPEPDLAELARALAD
jgi:hypothetical protein